MEYSFSEEEYDTERNEEKEIEESTANGETYRIVTDKETIESENTKEAEEVFRRSSRSRNPPQYLDDYVTLALHAEHYVEDIPQSFQEIHEREDKEKWKEANFS
ncbi:hypothetical protein QE152_g26173 [Popillia japonica]|uniref:Uncharacterized protein n=1 Tax=Popillia japonica TaxID=7064 RepID=A0AAW1JYP2_POPJA